MIPRMVGDLAAVVGWVAASLALPLALVWLLAGRLG